jgi:FKBP-type peptidyl-prolyl cis-trans isomerase FkpA
MFKKNNQTFLLFLTALLMLMVISCDPSKNYEKEEKAAIQDYLNSNSNLNFVLKPSGLYYLEVLAGSGPLAAIHDTVYLKYTGKFLDGSVLDTNVGTTDTLKRALGEGYLIAGIDEGVSYMSLGGKSTLLIPSKLAYGTYGSYPYISGYTPLLFDIELVRIKAGVGK